MYEICFEPDEYARILGEKTCRAGTPRRCGECLGVIAIGDRYRVETIIFDNSLSVEETCVPCWNIRRSLLNCGWNWGELWTIIHEAYCDAEYCICPTEVSR